MKVQNIHKNKCGIYCIRNTVNNKVYIGKSINISERIYNHIGGLNARDSKRENSYFINSWWKYGKDSFEYFILEYLDKEHVDFESYIKERELYWMNVYESTNNNFGYNLRMDSSTNIIVHDLTRKKMSDSHKKRYEDIDERLKTGESSKEFWKNNPEKKNQMSKKVSLINTKFKIHQLDKQSLKTIKIWDTVMQIIEENPTYKKHNIYAVCSGEKPSMYGYKWIKVLIDDIVQTD